VPFTPDPFSSRGRRPANQGGCQNYDYSSWTFAHQVFHATRNAYRYRLTKSPIPRGSCKSIGRGSEGQTLKDDSVAIIDVHLHLFEDLEENERILAQCKNAGIDKICAFLSAGAARVR